MSTITLIKQPTPSAVGDLPTLGEMLAEILPLIGVVVVAGPPVILLVGPLVLGALLLAGPFAVIATFVAVVLVALIAAAVLVALAGEIVATAYRAGRRLRACLERHKHRGASAGQRVAVESRHGAA
jgi:hypothetical protein